MPIVGKASDKPGDFISQLPRSAKIARCGRCSDRIFTDRRDRRIRSPISGMSDIGD